jgi:Nuclease-related domain
MPESVPARRWVQRAEGDRRSRVRLHLVQDEEVVVLNDRRIPGSKESINLIAVSPAGVFVIDTKHYKGLVHTMRSGTIGNLGPHELHVGRRNCTQWVEDVRRQAEIVRTMLGSAPWGGDVPVQAMLCLTRAEWGFASAVRIGEVWVGWPRLMAGQVQGPGALDASTVQEVSTMIADGLPVQ